MKLPVFSTYLSILTENMLDARRGYIWYDIIYIYIMKGETI